MILSKGNFQLRTSIAPFAKWDCDNKHFHRIQRTGSIKSPTILFGPQQVLKVPGMQQLVLDMAQRLVPNRKRMDAGYILYVKAVYYLAQAE